MWDEKINGDSETRNWLAANTKPCPKCSKPVEKNGGCNLVMCKCGQVGGHGLHAMSGAARSDS
jgi:ariadne-1